MDNIQITDFDGNIIGSVRDIVPETDRKKLSCSQFILKGKELSIAKFYADRTMFNLLIHEDGHLIEELNCIIIDHSFCYSESETSAADTVTLAYGMTRKTKPPVNEEDFEKWLEKRFVW